MIIDFSEIEYYVKHHEQRKNAWYRPYCGEDEISPTRQEVVLRLCKETESYERFPVWNHDLVLYVFPFYKQFNHHVILLPIVGSGKYFDAKMLQYRKKDYLIIDLLNVADYTTSVLEMCYILHNLCHIHMHRYMMSKYFEAPKTFYEQLEYRFFCEGLIQYLSWNQNAANYRLKEARYIQRKKDALDILDKALKMREETIQKQILRMLETLELWQRFPDVAGMFYCDYLFQKGGASLLKAYANAGYKGSLEAMFKTDFALI